MAGQSTAGRYRVKATISVDRRIGDGADIVPFRVSRAARSVQALAGFLENPVRMLV